MAKQPGKADAERRATKVKIIDARLSFPHLFKPQERESDDGSTRENYNCTLLIPKDNPNIKKILADVKKAALAAKRKAWGDDESKWPKIPASMTCFKDGDNEDHFTTPREEYEGHYVMSCSAPLDRPPSVITNRKGSDDKWIEAEQGKKGAPYAGCYVNAFVDLYGQKKDPKRKMPNRINGTVEIVQFRRDGEPFGATPTDPNDVMDEDDVSYEGELDDEMEDEDDDLL